jgi:protocatechuate 3,4-dioxygenase beta subunit
MKRRQLFKSLGLLGATTLLPKAKATNPVLEEILNSGESSNIIKPPACVLIPSETAGPYPLDLINSVGIRSNITEGRAGLPVTLTLTIVNVNNNCAPIPNARVDIWQTDAAGVYSGYAQPGVNTVGQTFMRGIQMTNGSGQVTFNTIYPGWYNGRITHIHFQVFVNSILKATSQLCFPDATNTAVYTTNSLYTTKGINTSVANNAADMVFSDGYTNQLPTMTGSPTTSYTAAMTVGIAVPVTGVSDLEPETGGQFKLYQNYPNPFSEETAVPFTLNNAAKVQLDIYDMQGKKIASIAPQDLAAGKHEIKVKRKYLANHPAGNYFYNLMTTNDLGTFHQAKVMTIV